MSSFKLLRLVAACGLALGVAPAHAQEAAPAPAHVAIVDGTALINRDGQAEQAIANMPFIPGDHLRTTTGRAEILFPDGTSVDVDQFTEISLETPTEVRLTEGRALVRVPGARYTTVEYQLTTPETAIDAISAGEYRLSYPDSYESARADDFERWVSAQVDAAPVASASAQYLPPDLRMYGSTFDQYGGWQYDSAYGYVWYPTVASTWRPYYDGYWAPVRPYGWTWIGAGPWSWPTHHYGRWGWHHDRWFWIPARSWAPAWVAWGSANDYVSWCPLGWDSRPVFALSVGYADPWRGWTVVPRGVFGYTRINVPHHRVWPERVNLVATPFVVQARPPVAVPRAAASAPVPAPPRPTAVPRPYGGQVPVQVPGVRTGAGSAYDNQPPQRTPGTAVPRAAPIESTPPPSRVVPPPRSTEQAPPPAQAAPRGGSTPRQEPTTRQPAQAAPAQPAQPTSRPQAQPRAEGDGGRQQQAKPSGGRGQGQQSSEGKAHARGKSKG